ncbi:uncharacterized protein F5891DRAFT_1194569 [Suillus fuscotomentosus]|uniref:Uncharacterized protein n=1 Tax=Suillus fuscotomentosus TaxID=1912939 RepID=A0AAD4HEW1_9AGAM|nr:uncharacterized protein F5891DRAFT_1194569 [Suillus fuscotomentosus]KAG1895065.1 hypothetical protein F5891DRAFT_1194569 [Suillus fuscotomentosus]
MDVDEGGEDHDNKQRIVVDFRKEDSEDEEDEMFEGEEESKDGLDDLEEEMSTPENDQEGGPPAPHISLSVNTSPQARAKRRIAALMEEVEILKQDKATKQRKTTYYVSQGRAICRLVVLFIPIEDIVAKNDWCCENGDDSSTLEQDRLQHGYIELVKVLPWFHDRLASLDLEESEDMLRKLRRGTDSARGDDTATLKELVGSWVNTECHPSLLIRPNDKHGQVEWRWEDPVVRAGICDRTTAFIVSENSWPSFMYENYKVDATNLERGLFKSKLLVMGFKAIFTSPSSANEVDGDGDAADIIENDRRAWRRLDQSKLANITSWRAVDGDFDYNTFWNNVVDFFEDSPGPAARLRVKELLEWWTQLDLTADVTIQMSVNVLAAQRQQMEDAAYFTN